MTSQQISRETLDPLPNPIGLDGIEYVEYLTSRPQALGQVLEMMGFSPVARHRSRDVVLYRQGTMNVIVNSQPGVVRGMRAPTESPRIVAIALRVRDARAAYDYVVERGGWDVPMHAQVMELNIPGIHGPGGAHLYFVDRHKEFSIYDVDFTLIPTVNPKPPALAGLHFFGIVQYIGRDRTEEWCDFYRQLMGFAVLPEEQRYGIMPKGTLIESPCRQFLIQLVEPDPATALYDEEELFHRIGLGTPDVPAAVALLRARGVEFLEGAHSGANERGALTRHYQQTLVFELVRDNRAVAP
ncbi:MAG: 4-hydroxyphenylpyruvate dioxygenase [Burkholderiales bacterium]|nr:4-hydroxyphenylpyruvate dioxygenase [Burkholderiales bacterium]